MGSLTTDDVDGPVNDTGPRSAWVCREHPGSHRLVAQLADAARSDRADRGSNPREPTNRRGHAEGDIVEGKDAALSAREYGFESRCPRQDGLASMRREGTATLEVS